MKLTREQRIRERRLRKWMNLSHDMIDRGFGAVRVRNRKDEEDLWVALCRLSYLVDKYYFGLFRPVPPPEQLELPFKGYIRITTNS